MRLAYGSIGDFFVLFSAHGIPEQVVCVFLYRYTRLLPLSDIFSNICSLSGYQRYPYQGGISQRCESTGSTKSRRLLTACFSLHMMLRCTKITTHLTLVRPVALMVALGANTFCLGGGNSTASGQRVGKGNFNQSCYSCRC